MNCRRSTGVSGWRLALGHRDQIDRAIRVPHDVNSESVQVDFAQMDHTGERFYFVEVDRQMLEASERIVGGVAYLKLIDRHLAAQSDLGRARRADEMQLQLR